MHAVAYVMMSFRIAYYKVHYPAEFYAVYLTTKIADFNWEVISCGKQAVINRMEAITIKGNNATAKENDELTVLEIVYEMFARGYEFMKCGNGFACAGAGNIRVRRIRDKAGTAR